MIRHYLVTFFEAAKDYITNIPTTTLVIGSLIFIAIAVFITWKVTMSNVNKKYEQDIFGEADYNWKIKRFSKDYDDTYYRKKLDLRAKEILVWQTLYNKYGKNLITFGFVEYNAQTASIYIQRGCNYSIGENLIEIEVYDEETKASRREWKCVKIGETNIIVRDAT